MATNTLEKIMYAVVSSGGKQYRVEAGSTLTLERLQGEPGASVTFDRVLLIGDGDDVTVGTPVVAGASVSATVLGEALGPKLVIFKFKQKVKYRRRTGHRQHLTRVRIDAINPTAGAARAAEEPKPKRAARPRAAKAAASEVASEAPAEAAAADKPKARRTPRPKAAAKE
ncbi:MAG TPA: 50S ribosomal protein L21 [Candidatus Limnocylindria bacterium]|nr:50S ribosomal protein L21 [Candidatus Limnocylindria bacterium]